MALTRACQEKMPCKGGEKAPRVMQADMEGGVHS